MNCTKAIKNKPLHNEIQLNVTKLKKKVMIHFDSFCWMIRPCWIIISSKEAIMRGFIFAFPTKLNIMNTSNKEENRSKIAMNCTNNIIMEKCYDQIEYIPPHELNSLFSALFSSDDSFGFDFAKKY